VPNIRLIVLHYKKTEIHGHRGCRGYFPENTLQGFLHAATLDIDAIEMDVVISKDHEVVVSHELYMHRKKCLWPRFETNIKGTGTIAYAVSNELRRNKNF
jgi:glycerophosphoryl diester phosphodiesterase